MACGFDESFAAEIIIGPAGNGFMPEDVVVLQTRGHSVVYKAH